MLETLAGRLKWEQTGDGITVELPVQLTWPNVLRTVGRWVLLWAIYCAIILLMDKLRGRSAQGVGFFLLFVPIYAAYGIWEILARRTVVTLNADEMTINRAFFQKDRSQRRFATCRLHNLVFGKSRPGLTAERRAIKNSLLCDVESKTIGHFEGLTEEEADGLIARMMAVYPFPKYLAAEPAAGVEATNGVWRLK